MLGALFGNMNFDGLNSPMGQMGLEMIAHHGTPTTQGGPNLTGALQRSQQYAQAQQQEQQQKDTQNRTQMLLRAQNPELAQLVEAGVLQPKDAINQMFMMQQEQRKAQQERENLRFKAQMEGGKDRYMPVGGHLFDPETNGWISPPQDAAAPMSTVGKINADFNAGLIDQPTRDALIQKAGQSDGMVLTSDGQGGFSLRQGAGLGEGGGGGNVNENLNAGFLLRSRDSHSIISDLETEGTSLRNKVYRNLPGGVGNYGLSSDAQRFEQAKRDFVNAVLRRESGAVISVEEFANADQQYFPQPGDGDEVIAQKRKNRENAIKAFEFSAGPAAPAADGGVVDYTDFFSQ